MNSCKATIKDVAREAGVSITTVSHALNNFSDVSEQTRSRILEVAKRLNYTPNPAGRSLGGISKNILSLILVGTILPKDNSSFVYAFMSGINHIACKTDYDFLLMTASNEKQERITFDQLCKAKEISGAIVFGMSTTSIYWNQVAESHVPCCCLDTYLQNSGSSTVTIDNVAASREITEHLISQGYRNIGAVCGYDNAEVSLGRFEGYKQALQNAGMDLCEDYVVRGNFSAEDTFTVVSELLDKHPEIDGLVCSSDDMAYGAYQAALKLGKKVPDDIGITGFDGSLVAEFYRGGITTIVQHPYEMGMKAAEIVIDMINGKEVPKLTCMSYELTKRLSTDRQHELPADH